MPKKRKPKAKDAPRDNAVDNDPRFATFAELYIESGKQYQSAIKAGYSPSYAKSKASSLAGRVRVKMGDALRACGINQVALARRIKAKLDAKEVKWNPNKVIRAASKATETTPELPELRGGWDSFVAHGTQQRAIETSLELLDAYPAKRIAGADGGDLFANVKIVSSIKRPPPPPRAAKLPAPSS